MTVLNRASTARNNEEKKETHDTQNKVQCTSDSGVHDRSRNTTAWCYVCVRVFFFVKQGINKDIDENICKNINICLDFFWQGKQQQQQQCEESRKSGARNWPPASASHQRPKQKQRKKSRRMGEKQRENYKRGSKYYVSTEKRIGKSGEWGGGQEDMSMQG